MLTINAILYTLHLHNWTLLTFITIILAITKINKLQHKYLSFGYIGIKSKLVLPNAEKKNVEKKSIQSEVKHRNLRFI